MGVKMLATLTAVATLATPAGYVQAQQREDGGFGDPQLTAWATLGLVAAGAETGRAAEYLARQQPTTATDRALVAMARAAAGDRPDDLLPGLRAYRPARLVNATIWTILALRQAGEPVPAGLVTSLRRRAAPQRRLVVARGRRRGHERHGRRNPGAPRRRRQGTADRPRNRLSPPPPERRRWLRADA